MAFFKHFFFHFFNGHFNQNLIWNRIVVLTYNKTDLLQTVVVVAFAEFIAVLSIYFVSSNDQNIFRRKLQAVRFFQVIRSF